MLTSIPGDFRSEICVVGIRFRLHCMPDNTPVADFGNWTTVARLNSERIGQNHCDFACLLSGGVHCAQGDIV